MTRQPADMARHSNEGAGDIIDVTGNLVEMIGHVDGMAEYIVDWSRQFARMLGRLSGVGCDLIILKSPNSWPFEKIINGSLLAQNYASLVRGEASLVISSQRASTVSAERSAPQRHSMKYPPLRIRENSSQSSNGRNAIDSRYGRISNFPDLPSSAITNREPSLRGVTCAILIGRVLELAVDFDH